MVLNTVASQAIMHDFPVLRDMPAPRGEAFPPRASEWNSTPEAGKSPQGFLMVQPGISNPWLIRRRSRMLRDAGGLRLRHVENVTYACVAVKTR